MLTLNDGRSELWQWDTGRTLAVDADCSQVHFSNKVFGRSIDVDVVDGVAIIPNILLQTDKELTAWAFVGTPENGYTKIGKVFKVNKRNKPADYVFTPPEQTTLGEILERLDDIESAQDPDAIKNAVDDYLANNPIEIDEKDPTVPAWAKQPTKPSYTAPEVGALPADTVIPTKPGDIGAQPETLMVNFDRSNPGYATHTAGEIYEHYQNGGDVIYIDADSSRFELYQSYSSQATFCVDYVTESNVNRAYVLIDTNGQISYRRDTFGGLITSVNGKTGAVVLTAADVGALPSDTVIPEAVTDAHINSLIDAKLAAIPNAAEVAY